MNLACHLAAIIITSFYSIAFIMLNNVILTNAWHGNTQYLCVQQA